MAHSQILPNHPTIRQQLADLSAKNLYRTHNTITQNNGVYITINKKRLVNFASNDYLNLASDERVKTALIKGAKQSTVGSGAAHLISGHHHIHHQLATALADYVKADKVLLFATGYLANLAVFSALRDDISWVMQDKLNHASLLDGNRLIELPIRRYPHRNLNILKRHLSEKKTTGLIASDHIFSMDGDQADSRKLYQLSTPEHFLLLDDAHGFTLFNNTIVNQSNTFYMATLGKALGTMGAFIAGNAELIDFIRQKARPYIYTTALSPALCYATLASLQIAQTNEQQKCLFANIALFKQYAHHLGLSFMPSNSAIQPLLMGGVDKALQLAKTLYKKGFYVGAVRPPTVPPKTARLRITLSAGHDKLHIEKLLETIKNALA